MDFIDVDDLVPMAQGAAILGTGGGGDPHIGRLLAEQAIRDHSPVTVCPLERLPDEAVVIPVGFMGAPTVMVEKLPPSDQVAQSVQALARYLGVEPTHVACLEAGGVNSTVPLVAAAELGLPLVDGDGMGRAFPELQMVLPSLEGISATPMAIADEKGNTGVYDTVDNHWAERLARSATVDMGCSATVSLYPMSGEQCRRSYVPGTLSLCRDIGARIARARADHQDPVEAVAERLGGHVLLDGKVTDVVRRTTTGFARGEARIAGTGPDSEHQLVLNFQNEHLVAYRDGIPAVTTPDLIIVVETDSGQAVTTESLRYGQRVRVLAAPADPRWHSRDGIDLVGPRYFGYDLDPVGIEARVVT